MEIYQKKKYRSFSLEVPHKFILKVFLVIFLL